ncbi:squalene/phytoene synthase family protein [Paracoccus luteus]|uniref:squalene/phytoene synthase family protein n=1 Tax=Paracoccus luteus TaxID=2508543 RepID=UPI00106FF52F|nr:squalene/phytoene synthase family protein [Paracoccus luteus]
MSLEALTGTLQTGDPDRLAMALMAPRAARPRLITLYALNLELARTPLAARDPLIAEMRVQWWVDRLAGLADGPPPPHELLTPLWAAWGDRAARFAALAEARRRDAARRPFAAAAEAADYAAATGGAVMTWAAAELGGHGPAVRAQGQGAAIVAWLRAEPALRGMGMGWSRPDAGHAAELAATGRAALARAAAERRPIPRAASAVLFAGVGPQTVLDAAAAGGAPRPVSEFARRAALARLALTGRWWIGAA